MWFFHSVNYSLEMILKKISLVWIIIVFHVLDLCSHRKTVVKCTFALDVNETGGLPTVGHMGSLSSDLVW